MARGKMDANHRPNTLKENRMILSELRSRGKIEHKTLHELNKLFAKWNSNSALEHWKNGKAAASAKQEKVPVAHPYGPVEGFPTGSWWGIRMDCSRDGVHIPFNTDIQDGPAGAVSVCTSHLNTHNDEDLGNFLTFTGCSYKPGVKPDDPLLRSYQSQVPLRLVRSYNLTNEFAPKTGYRYDGLYSVAAYWIGVTSDTDKYYKFALVRVRNQEPPTWAKSVASKSMVSDRKPNPAQTRCNAERFSTNLCGDTHSSANEQESTTNSRRRIEPVKLTFAKSTNANIADQITRENKRNPQESTIVTRCISVKKTDCPSSRGMTFVSYGDSPVQNAHRTPETYTKPAPCKLQNTNISIRTDLYDSSHNIQHEAKRNIPMTFCRTFVTARNSRVVNHSTVGPLNLNSCGPCPRDGEQESLIQSRSCINKASTTQSPYSDSNRSAGRSTPKVSSLTCPTEGTVHSERTEKRPSDLIRSIDPSDCATDDRAKTERLEQEQRDKENSPSKLSNDIDGKTTENKQTVSPSTRTSSKKIASPFQTDKEELREDILKEHRTVLDSLTPDQMLKYIVKKKYHPTAKLLIGSVIGLATGESTILRTYDSLMSRSKTWSLNKKLREQSESSGNEKREFRQSASGNSTAKERLGAKPATQKVGMKDRIYTMRLRRTRVSKRLQGSEKKSSTKSAKKEGTQKSKDSAKPQQPFSKSTSPKNSKTCAKKRRSELANLVIDANIGPIVRGPRNRRLRGSTHIFAKKRHEMEMPGCCAGSRIGVGAKGKKATSGVELPSKRSKRLTSATKTRMPESRYIQHKQRVLKTEASKIEERKRKNLGISPENREKRKASRSRSRSREREFVGGEIASKKLCQRSEKDVGTMRRIITMVDAATQCSDRRDAATCIDSEVEDLNRSAACGNSVKVEWIDLDDVKSESCASDEEEELVLELANQTHRNSGNQTTSTDVERRDTLQGLLPIRPRAEKLRIVDVTQRSSAFVPVNISDSDFRIARLRSIGFKPIGSAGLEEGNDRYTENCAASGSSKDTAESTVVSRVADEQYNKYTSEETTAVGYMDQELRFEDIEEDVLAIIRGSKNARTAGKIEGTYTGGRNKGFNSREKVCVETVKSRRGSTSLEDDTEIPWHGWKKLVKNKEAHWAGW